LFIIQFVNNFSYSGAIWYEKLRAYSNIIKKKDIIRDLVSILNSIIFFIPFVYYRKKLSLQFRNYNVLLNIYVIDILLSRLFMTGSNEFGRLVTYFSMAMFLLVSFIICSLNKNKRSILAVFIIAYCFFRYWEGFRRYWDLFFPYISIFEAGIKTRILYEIF
jgi:membrane-associated HD superfamily phosphohydrolase